MAKLTPEKIDDLKRQHGRTLYLYEDEEAGDIVLKPASRDVWDEFQDTVSGDNVSAPTRSLVDACVVFPDMAELQRVHDELPALADTLARLIREKSGGRKAAEAKKL